MVVTEAVEEFIWNLSTLEAIFHKVGCGWS